MRRRRFRWWSLNYAAVGGRGGGRGASCSHVTTTPMTSRLRVISVNDDV